MGTMVDGYKIKLNDYRESDELRPEVVQMLIDYFIENLDCENCFLITNKCEKQTHSIGYDMKGKLKLLGDYSHLGEYKDIKIIRTSEIKKFFEVWVKAKYFIYYQPIFNNSELERRWFFTNKTLLNQIGVKVTGFPYEMDK